MPKSFGEFLWDSLERYRSSLLARKDKEQR